ncbi:MAG: FAD-dependent oxidoreductase [Oscillospiraceae bacterium]|nr:FAD-dependent oxidoreductase [Oscillospiraceae bacterium]
MYDIIIIGGGPAGLTAATYARRAGKTVLVIEKNAFGGQITWSPKVENFPSHVSISGAELGDRLLEQAMEQGAEVELEEVTAVNVEGDIKTVLCESGAEFQGKALIIATGAKPRMLGLPREAELIGSGVCFCAVCDGAFYKGCDVAVNGGGNSALQDAVLLSEKCSKVYLIHRRDSFRGEAALVDILRKKTNVEFVLEASITALEGENELTAITVNQKGAERRIPVQGLFVAIGHAPDNGIFSKLIELDRAGYAASGEDCLTRSAGIFVAGDCRAKSVHQLTTAVADGSVAALAACSWLDAAK